MEKEYRNNGKFCIRMLIVVVMPTAISYTKSIRIDCRKGRNSQKGGRHAKDSEHRMSGFRDD